MLDKKLYTKILASVPVLTVDLIVENHKGEYLLVKRNNEPLKGEYYVPGGRVIRGESIIDAVQRKLKQETGLSTSHIDFVGFSDDKFYANEYELDYIHTVSLVFKCTGLHGDIKIDKQSSDYIWSFTLPEMFKVIKP